MMRDSIEMRFYTGDTMGNLRNLILAAALTAITSAPVTAQSVEDVLARYDAAVGGVDAWTGLSTMKAKGTINVMGGMMAGPFTIVQKRPAMARVDITVQGMTIVQAFDGETAWQVVPFTGSTAPQVADAETASQIIEQADLDGPLIGWKEAGHQVELAGMETIDGVEATKLKLTLNTGEVTYYYLDADFLPIKIVAVRGVQGVESELTTTLGDYKEVGGLMFPFKIEVDTPLGVQALNFDTIEVNVDVDDAVFSMPSGS